jgi:hypothetical protein
MRRSIGDSGLSTDVSYTLLEGPVSVEKTKVVAPVLLNWIV